MSADHAERRARPARLTSEELASAVPVAAEEIGLLVEHGMLRPASDGLYARVDIQRVRAVMAMRSPGISLQQLLPAFEAGLFTLEPIDMLFPEPAAVSGQTWRDVARSAGVDPEEVLRLVVAAGFPKPAPDDPAREDDAALARDLLTAGQLMGGGEKTARMVRIFGEATRRSAERGLALFDEGDDIRSRPRQEMRDPLARREMNERAGKLMRMSEDILGRLFRRHLEHGLLHVWASAAEAWLDELGIRPTPDTPPAVAFVDLTGYTMLTETAGDLAAARLAARLGELAETAAVGRGGRVVKLLGDGAMLHFDEPHDAVRGALDLVAAIDSSDLPAAHAGVHSGPVIHRDGDFFGRTVNVASRISGVAAPGHVLVSADVAQRPARDLYFEALGERELKGIGALELFKARWTGAVR